MMASQIAKVVLYYSLFGNAAGVDKTKASEFQLPTTSFLNSFRNKTLRACKQRNR